MFWVGLGLFLVFALYDLEFTLGILFILVGSAAIIMLDGFVIK